MAIFSVPFSVIQWNIRGIRNKIQWLKCPPFSKAEGFVFQESLLKDGDSFSYPGIMIYRQDRTSRGGGLVTAINNKFTSAQIDLASLSTQGVEALGVNIWINRRWVTIINVYAPEGRVSESWLQCLANTIHHPLLILGDFNQKHHASLLTLRVLRKSLTGSSITTCAF